MINQLTEIILPFIIRHMAHKKETLTQKEQGVQEKFLTNLHIKKRKTKKPVIVAMIGLAGSGKSSVAKELANLIGANIIEGDEIRVLLRKEGERYEGVRKIAENAALEIIKKGGSVVMDSDHVDQKKRASLREKAKRAGAKLLFIRTYSDFDIMAGRIITAAYYKDDFFGGASTKWQESEQSKGAVVKIREMWRRTPHHYRWDAKAVSGGGNWVLKKLPFDIFVSIDTSNSKYWKSEIKKAAQKILSF